MIETNTQRSQAAVRDPVCGMEIDPAQAFGRGEFGGAAAEDIGVGIDANTGGGGFHAWPLRWLSSFETHRFRDAPQDEVSDPSL